MEIVSFLIPAFNHEKYIVATLGSIEQDDYPSKEIVVIDDGSIDGTAEAVRQWIQGHPHVDVKFQTRENKGLTATLNELIEMASGGYLRLFSSDDLLIRGSTIRMVSYLERHPRLSAVFSDVTVIDSDGKKIADSALEMNGANIANYDNSIAMKKEIIANWAVSGPAILIRKNWYQENGRYREDMLIDDWDLYLRLISSEAIAFCNVKSAHYRRHDMNTCRTSVVIKRIQNLKSQLLAADRNLGKFSGTLKVLMRRERAMLAAKIQFLSRRYVKCVGYLLQYIAYSIRGRI